MRDLFCGKIVRVIKIKNFLKKIIILKINLIMLFLREFSIFVKIYIEIELGIKKKNWKYSYSVFV